MIWRGELNVAKRPILFIPDSVAKEPALRPQSEPQVDHRGGPDHSVQEQGLRRG